MQLWSTTSAIIGPLMIGVTIKPFQVSADYFVISEIQAIKDGTEKLELN